MVFQISGYGKIPDLCDFHCVLLLYLKLARYAVYTIQLQGPAIRAWSEANSKLSDFQ